jgi:SAM-dependent methyltransferase
MDHGLGSPTSWLVDHAHVLPTSGTALDVACGRGRHAIWLAEHGLTVRAVDRDADAIETLAAEARNRGLAIRAELCDLEGSDPALGHETTDVIVVVHYLHRSLFPSLIRALRTDGLLVYETFTQAQAKRGKPTNPAFLLAPGELLELIAPLEVISAREGVFDGRDVASVLARKLGR